jgi:phosphoglucosamine mutase
MRSRGVLRNDLVVVTPMSNLGMRLALDALGVNYEDAPVGDRNVLERMRQRDAVLGGEQSGHIIYLDRHTTGDGIVSALQLLAVMRRSGRRLSDLAGIFRPAPQTLINVPVRAKPDLATSPELQAAISEAERALAGKGRVLLRYSGTQPLCRVMVEAPTEALTHTLAAALAAKVRALLG